MADTSFYRSRSQVARAWAAYRDDRTVVVNPWRPFRFLLSFRRPIS